MDVQLQLSREEARLLGMHLERYLTQLHAELVRTDQRALHKSLAVEIEALRTIAERLDASAPSVRRPVVHG
jgi:hypothetical protein